MKTPINNGILQSDIDFAGFNALNFSGGATPAPSRKFDVKTYGAIGDGMTDDTTAIQAALAAVPATGGVLYFPPGQYLYAGSTLVLDRRITVEGDGGGIEASSTTDSLELTLSVSTIDVDSSTGTLFDVQTNGCAFKNIQLRNISVTTPTGGAGIVVSAGGDRTNYENITVNGFYVNIEVQNGWQQNFHNCYIIAPVLYGLKLRHILHTDFGDHSISNCHFFTARSRAATSAIRIESGGGVKIVNSKFNMLAFLAYPWSNAIDLALASGVGTADLLVSNCSIESFSAFGIKGTTTDGTGQWVNIIITGNQFGPTITGTQYGIYLSPTSAGQFNGVAISGNLGASANSSNPFIYLSNCSNVVLTGNSTSDSGPGFPGFNGLISIGSGVTFSRSATIPPGGTTGQVLTKLSNADYDIGWA